MADQPKQRGVTLARFRLTQARQIAPRGNQRRAVAVLQSAVVIVHHVEQKGVVRKRHIRRAGRYTVPEADRGLADFLRVAQQALTVK